jgi:hypothetical protein
MARTETAWRCSQCGAINEAGTRACSSCGKWPSLFDLQDRVEPEEVEAARTLEPELFETDTFDPETFEPETYLPETYEDYDAQRYETGPETGQPPVEGEDAEDERSRFPRWLITALWVIGILVWLVVNALGDRG